MDPGQKKMKVTQTGGDSHGLHSIEAGPPKVCVLPASRHPAPQNRKHHARVRVMQKQLNGIIGINPSSEFISATKK